ncbi:MAG: fused MFS/spermidine synthase, partial [Theionarchaea archaeon]|nr:fused MFS/spermidine synthase [Theionarchaea archaeon]
MSRLNESSRIWILRAQVFVVGAGIMSLELTASRILAPDFGNSIYVWGSLIGIILTALSLGYMFGGRLADRKLSFRIFCATIFLSGLLVLFIPFFSPVVMDLALGSGLGLRYGPLLVTALLMGFPTFLLGMVAPYAIKLATRDLSSLGNVSGSLYSLSTFGSIVGTFVTVFVLIPSIGVRSIITLIGILLMATSLPGLKWGPRFLALASAIVVLSPVGSVVQQLQTTPGDVVFEKDTPYSHLLVKDQGGTRIMFLNGMPDSGMYLNDSIELVFAYTRYFALGWTFNQNISRVLFVGGGGFSGPKKFLRDYPTAKVDVVEIDPDVILAARRYFHVNETPRLTVFNQDGRTYLTHTQTKYDLIVLDAYTKTYVPFHLLTREFFELLYDRLTKDGVIVSNLIASFVGDTSDLFWAEYKTIELVFPSLYVFRTTERGSGWVQNIILVVTKDDDVLTRDEIARMGAGVPSVDSEELESFSDDLWNEIPDITDLPLLTDDYSPVEML